MKAEIPVIDISGLDTADSVGKANLARQVDDTFTNTGFMTIIGHGVPRSLLDAAASASRRFFPLPVAEKMKCAQPGRARGFVPFGEVSAARGQGDVNAVADLKEAFVIGPLESAVAGENTRRSLPSNIWPTEPLEFRYLLESYYVAMELLAFRLLRLFGLALRLPEQYFLPAYAAHNCIQRIQYYPAQSTPPLTGQLRISAHTDVGAFAIVGVDKGIGQGGLQLLDKQQKWIDIVSPEDSFVVNVGDLLSTWTNDRWQSTLHRVMNPLPAYAGIARTSIAFHANPSFDAMIEALPTCVDSGATPLHPPVRAGDHRALKVNKTNAAANTEGVLQY